LRKVRDGEATKDLFAVLTTEPNVIGAPIHTTAMPVILATQEEIDSWMSARVSTNTI
jgi:putative SOS response-associated peptidase YedK